VRSKFCLLLSSTPIVQMDYTCLVPRGSPIARVSDVDADTCESPSCETTRRRWRWKACWNRRSRWRRKSRTMRSRCLARGVPPRGRAFERVWFRTPRSCQGHECCRTGYGANLIAVAVRTGKRRATCICQWIRGRGQVIRCRAARDRAGDRGVSMAVAGRTAQDWRSGSPHRRVDQRVVRATEVE